MLTSRLAQADPSLSILLIEQGKDNHHVPKVIHPGLFPENLEPDSDSAIFWQGNKSPELAGRAPIVPSGGILGGGSSINWMVFTRGQRSDYDSWNMKGWSAEDVLPFLKKVCMASVVKYEKKRRLTRKLSLRHTMDRARKSTMATRDPSIFPRAHSPQNEPRTPSSTQLQLWDIASSKTCRTWTTITVPNVG